MLTLWYQRCEIWIEFPVSAPIPSSPCLASFCHWPNVFGAPETPTAQLQVQVLFEFEKSLHHNNGFIVIPALLVAGRLAPFCEETFQQQQRLLLNGGRCPGCLSSPADDTVAALICDSSSYLLCLLSVKRWPPLQLPSHLHVYRLKSLLHPPHQSNRCLLALSRFFICHICRAVSILHATLNKQTICPITSSLRASFFTSSLSAICHLLLNLSEPFSHLVIPSRLRSASVPVPPNSPPARRLPLSCRTWKDSFSLLCLLWLCAAPSPGWICHWKSERALWRILNLKPSQTESVYLRVTTFLGAAGCIGSPPLVPRNRLIMFTTAALWWESSS